MSASLRPVGGEPAALLELLVPWVRDGGDPLVVRTSGSTGEPKDVVLSHRAVVASARATEARLGGPGRWLLALPTSGVAGLQVLVRSVLAGEDPVVLSDHPDLEPALDALAVGPGRTYASLVPTQLHRLDRDGRLDLLARLDALLVGGAGVDPGLVGRARRAGVNVVRTYGMSETCGGCVYDGRPLDGVQLRIAASGEIEVAGPVLFDGYGAAPFEGEWFATRDLGSIDDDGVLSVLGRADDVVISGGVNVPLPRVEEALRRVPGVADAAAVGVPDPEWGHRVVAVVVRDGEDPPTGLPALRDALERLGLDRRWAPRGVLIVEELPLLPGGKIDRRAVAAVAERA
ncbi:o-succinylbenzoate--CoA ligase [Aeromicrobium halocynthiae]|uniref:O-succinylbenzoate--CoA ligase n=1 Tax=Aeromicrobium halocynthiae TaxID=560557 RepID=A0ABN2VYL0_9ACTN